MYTGRIAAAGPTSDGRVDIVRPDRPTFSIPLSDVVGKVVFNTRNTTALATSKTTATFAPDLADFPVAWTGTYINGTAVLHVVIPKDGFAIIGSRRLSEKGLKASLDDFVEKSPEPRGMSYEAAEDVAANRIAAVLNIAREKGLTRIFLGKPPSNPPLPPIITQSESWLRVIDDARYTESWSTASSLFQKALTQAQWETSLRSVRAPLGKVLERRLLNSQQLQKLPNTPGGPHMVSQFSTRFENDSDAVETVTFTRDDDGLWRASGYFIK